MKNRCRPPSMPPQTNPVFNSRQKELLEKGASLFNTRHFFEAHECWEEVWKELAPPHRDYLQAAIQLAVAYHKEKEGKLKGALKLFQKAGEKALNARGDFFRVDGVRLDRFIEARHLEVQKNSGQFGEEPIPKITLNLP